MCFFRLFLTNNLCFYKVKFSILLFHQTSRIFEIFPYLAYFERHFTCVCFIELLFPSSFEVDGIDKNQLGLCINGVTWQQVLNFTFREK